MGKTCTGDLLQNWRDAWQVQEWPPPVSCLQVLVLEALPCAVLLVTCPVYVIWLLKRAPEGHPTCWRFLAKIVLSLCLAVVSITHCVLLHRSGDWPYMVVRAAWALVAVVNVLLICIEHSRNRIRSPVLFVFWLVASGNGVLLLIMSISRQDYIHDLDDFVINILWCILTPLMFVLHCMSDFHGPISNIKNPESEASPLSWLTFTWLNRLILSGFKKPLTNADLYPMMPEDSSIVVRERLMKHWGVETTGSPGTCDTHESEQPRVRDRPTFSRCLLQTFLGDMCVAHCGTIVLAAANLVTPIILGWLIDYATDVEEPTWHGYIYLAALVLVRLMGALADQAAQYLCNRLAIRVRTAAVAAIFNKALTMRQNTQKGSSVGEIVNLMSVDTKNLELFLVYSCNAWSGLFHLVFGAYLCYTVSGISMATGFGFIVAMLAVNLLTNQRVGTYQEELMNIGDRRLKVVSEVLDGMKVIKLHAWEPLFSEKIASLRRKELKVLLHIALFGILETFAFTASKFWMTFCILATFVALRSSHHLDAKRAFLIINYINIINMAVLCLPLVVKLGVKMRISLSRIDDFLQTEDVGKADFNRDTKDPFALRITKSDFKWEASGPITLRDIDLQVRPGQLVAVVGAVGCGKSSLLAAALGEMVRVGGYSNINSSVAHVPQEAWIQNLTIKENILFGRELDKAWYKAVVKACSLRPDLDMLPAGDSTEIGEKGINLSGGQKQRVSLARAVYSQADIYLLDDPLSAVDSHVGKSIFREIIGPEGLLKAKTRVLVTHGLQWLPYVDHIFVMEDGRIKEAGTYKELTASTDGAFAKFVDKFILTSGSQQPDNSKKKSSTLTRSVDGSIEEDDLIPSVEGGESGPNQLTLNEKLGESRIKWGVYLVLLRAYGWRYFALTVTLVLCFHGSFNAFYVLLSSYTDDRHLANFTELPEDSHGREDRNRHHFWLLAYCGLAQTAFSLLYASVIQWRHVTTSRVLHTQLLRGIMRAPISFFDTTPTGRILNRFSQDIDSLDSFVFFFLEICVEHGLFALGILGVISYAMPIMTIATVPTVVTVYFLQMFYSRSVCRLNRLASVSRSPVSAHFSETVSGLSVIRAHRQQARFIHDNQVKVDRFQSPALLAYAANKWMQLWLDLLGCFLLLVVTVSVILYREDAKPGLVGLSLSLVVAITTEFKAMSQKSSDLESNIVAVERIREYSKIPSEAPWNLPGDDDHEGPPQYDKATTIGPDTKSESLSKSRLCKPPICPPHGLFSSRVMSESKCHLADTSPTQSAHNLFPAVDSISKKYFLVNGYSQRSRYNVDSVDKKSPKTYGSISVGHANGVNGFYGNSINNSDFEEEGPYHEAVQRQTNANTGWPQTGKIQFVDFSCRYRKDTEQVLKRVSFVIKGGEKIGVVGRTGAGKSSLVLSLFRLVEADEGRILIDDVDIGTLGLHGLRRAITILPQDPVLFSGSVRDNLDPAHQRSDSELWKALEQAHLKHFVHSLPGELDAMVGDNGSNFSMGQRQLVCLARTLLCQTRVLVLDEATAAVDLETDSLVQATIHSAFAPCTVIAIAHRLSTILDYDRVLVLHQGKVLEFDSPKVLLAKPDSVFYSLASEAGLTSEENNRRRSAVSAKKDNIGRAI
ncbi:hypothetical protein EGW08_008573 [Elysia chlorotica]|uniref:ABC-type glutathione-S-conjugate transporter n=1 Tax=Elysia chlorotica TaxID=188477 RepID=A0A433TQ40_ELYCH|nr:hypothetical protein EGW08_008573 [Elysia chlorotica]